MTCWYHNLPSRVAYRGGGGGALGFPPSSLTSLPSWYLACQYSPLAYCTEQPDMTGLPDTRVYTSTRLVPTCASLVSSSGPACHTHQPVSTCPRQHPAVSPCSRYIGTVFLPDPLALSGTGVPPSTSQAILPEPC